MAIVLLILSHTHTHQLRLSEMEVHKAQNMIEHQKEIFSRPARTWIQPTAGKKRVAGNV